MPRVPPPKDTRFKPGVSGNKGGRPKLPPELKAFKEISSEEVKRLFAKYARASKEELKEALQAENTPCIELVIASGLARAIKDGDYSKLNFILDRTIGKVAEKTSIDLPEPLIIKRRNGDEVYLAAEKKVIE